MDLLCPLCPSERTRRLNFNVSKYLKHVRLFHAHQPNFHISCQINGCQRSYRNFSTFKNHVSDKHSCEALDRSIETTSLCDDFDDSDLSLHVPVHTYTENDELYDSMCLAQKSSALFLLGLKEEKKLTQTALQGCIEGVTTLSQIRLNAQRQEVYKVLNADGVSQATIDKLDTTFDENGKFGRPFIGLETPHQQLNYYSRNFNFIVSVKNYFPCYFSINLI